MEHHRPKPRLINYICYPRSLLHGQPKFHLTRKGYLNLYRNESSNLEILLVLFITLGNPIISSLALVFDGRSSSRLAFMSSDRLLFSVAYELVALGLVALILKSRGWTFGDLNLEINWRLTFTGLLLAVPVH